MPFLSDLLANGPIDFEYISHSPFQSFAKKTGGTYEAGELTIKTRSTGAISKEKIFNEAFYRGFTKSLTPGCLIRATKEGKYVNWSLVPSGEESLAVPSRPNSAQVKDERSYTEGNLEQKAKQKQISLAGVYQARLNSGMETDKARAAAIEDVAWLEKTGRNLAMVDDNQFADELPSKYVSPTPTIDVSDLPF